MARTINPTTPTITNRYQASAPVGVLVPASGVSSTLDGSATSGIDGSGPWFIETQSLRGYYKRVPVYGPSATTFSLTKPTCDYKVGYTFMESTVVAEYSITKSYDPFDTSAYTQLQQFEWFGASADAYGNSYGDASTVGVSALGPDGIFQTTIPWQNRRLWTSADDGSEVSYSIGGTKHIFRSEITPVQPGIVYTDGMELWGEFERTRWPKWANTFLNDGELHLWGADYDYQLPGPYNTGQESPILIANYIDGLGTDVTNKNLYRLKWNSLTGEGGASTGQVVPQDQGIAEYDITRHYWT